MAKDKKSQSYFLRLFDDVVGNVLANIVMVALAAIATIVATLYTGNPIQTLLFGLLILVAINLLLTLRVWSLQREGLQAYQSGYQIVRDSEAGEDFYLVDHTGKARRIPDEDTLTFLTNILRIEEVSTWTSRQIFRARGEDIITLTSWAIFRPRTPEEVDRQLMESQLRRDLEIQKLEYEPALDSVETVIVRIINRGNASLSIARVRFYERELKLSTDYQTVDHEVLVPLYGDLQPNQTIDVPLKLAQKWQHWNIDRLRGDLGRLAIDVMRGDKSLEWRHTL